ncbi:MAG: enoyl-CoA hydratase/isomerase family protein [Tabrizicola sp.]|nr:enoyl-CoA hydratase/isomerase family protein [Tabrizicola sp.]
MPADGMTIEARDDVLVLTLANPPGNSLTPGLRLALMKVIRDRVPRASALVLAAEGRNFSSVLPQSSDLARPGLGELCQAVADCPVPVVAVLHGTVMGPGAELALAAQARIAAPDLRLAFADVVLGLCPAGGSTQRLPRLIGAEAALRLLLSGRAVASSEAVDLGLVDGVTAGNAVSAAVRLAQAIAGGQRLRRAEPDPIAWQGAVARARRDATARSPAGQRIIDCVEAALLLPPENGLAFEAVAREDLEASPEAAALRAAARADRLAASLPPKISAVAPRQVSRIGLTGTGPDLVRLAVLALMQRLAVNWICPDPAQRRDNLRATEAALRETARQSGLPETSAAMLADLTLTEDPAALREAELTIGGAAGAGALKLAVTGSDARMELRLAPAGKAVELALPPGPSAEAAGTAIATLRRIGLAPVLVQGRAEAGERLRRAGAAALSWIIAQGVPGRAVLAALDAFGIAADLPPMRSAGLPLREMTAEEILSRWLGALANEGLRLVADGTVRRASDVDHLLVAGYGFPRWRGGPMHWAEERGLMLLRRDLRLWSGDDAIWAPVPLIDDLIRDGRRLAGQGAD